MSEGQHETHRLVQVAYGYLPDRISRKQAERFVSAHAAAAGVILPSPPVAKYWCRRAPDGAPAEWVIGFTAPVAVVETEVDADNQETLE